MKIKIFEKIRLFIANLLIRLAMNKRAVTSGEIIGLSVSFFLVAILGPIAIGTIANTTTTNWSSPVITVFQIVLPVIWAVAVAIRYLPGRE
jgi:hypothetical protein